MFFTIYTNFKMHQCASTGAIKTTSRERTFSMTGLALSGRLVGPPFIPRPPRVGRPRLPKLMFSREVMSFTDLRKKLPSSSMSVKVPLTFWDCGQTVKKKNKIKSKETEKVLCSNHRTSAWSPPKKGLLTKKKKSLPSELQVHVHFL